MYIYTCIYIYIHTYIYIYICILTHIFVNATFSFLPIKVGLGESAINACSTDT